jgi:hypothetical protein
MNDQARWWGAHEIEPGSAGQWTLGPLRLVGERRPFEWRMSSSAQRDPTLSEICFSKTDSPEPHGSSTDIFRYALDGEEGSLLLEPLLPDRPIDARPSMPFSVLGGHTVNLFVSTPLWVRVKLPNGSVLLDLPSLPLSETWFGETTRSGELCYASRTDARLDPDRLAHHPVRALTRICISNPLPDPVTVERVKIPASHLGLFIDKQDHLWTQAVYVERVGTNLPSKIWFETPTLRISDSVERVSPSRVAGGRGLLERAVHALIG